MGNIYVKHVGHFLLAISLVCYKLPGILGLDLSNLDDLDSIETDPHGYLTYCPCMGRFGVQVEGLMGAMAFARALNRTLVLPGWILYPGDYDGEEIDIVPYEKYFDAEKIKESNKVITLTDFMQHIADSVWPRFDRVSFCHSPLIHQQSGGPSCLAKKGNPAEPFWNSLNVDFAKSQFWGGLDPHPHDNEVEAEKWMKKFPYQKYPVLAFSSYPMHPTFREEKRNFLSDDIIWNTAMIHERDEFVNGYLGGGDFIGVHLPSEIEQASVCSVVDEVPQLMSTAQCLGYNNEFGRPTRELCSPAMHTIIKDVSDILTKVESKYVFVYSTDIFTIRNLEANLSSDVKVVWMEKPHLVKGLAILAAGKYFIGNCVSPLTAFVNKQRELFQLPTAFFAFHTHTQGVKHNYTIKYEL